MTFLFFLFPLVYITCFRFKENNLPKYYINLRFKDFHLSEIDSDSTKTINNDTKLQI